MDKEISTDFLIIVSFIIIGTILLKLLLSHLNKITLKKINKKKLVILPQILILTCNICSGIYLLLMCFFIVRDYTKDHIILSVCLFLLMIFFSIIFSRWKIIIGNDYFEIVPMIGWKKQLQFSDISNVRKKTSGSLVIISKRKKKVCIESLCDGYSNIYKILQRQGFLKK